MLKEELSRKQPKHLEREVEPKHIRQGGQLNHLEKKDQKTKHPEHKIIDSKEHKLPPQEELEIMINLCGNKKELIDVLNHINRMIIEAPKKVDGEIKVRKIR